MLDQVLKVSSGTCQRSVGVLSKSVTFLNFWLSQSSVATYCRWGGNLCDEYIENFLTNHLIKEFWKLVYICRSYYQTSRGLLFWEHGVTFLCGCCCWRRGDDGDNSDGMLVQKLTSEQCRHTGRCTVVGCGWWWMKFPDVCVSTLRFDAFITVSQLLLQRYRPPTSLARSQPQSIQCLPHPPLAVWSLEHISQRLLSLSLSLYAVHSIVRRCADFFAARRHA